MNFISIIRQLVWFVILAFLLPACNSPVEASPAATRIPLRLAYTPALQPLAGRLAACAEKLPEAALYLDKIPVGQFRSSDYDAVLQMGESPDAAGFAVRLGYDELKIVVNIKNPVLSIDKAELGDLFDGSQETWAALSPPNAVYVVLVQAWHYLPESELSDLAVTALLVTKVPSAARLASDPGQVLQGVRAEAGAVGLVPSSWLKDNPGEVKMIDLPAGSLPSKIPVLAITRSEPQGALRNLLACASNPGK